MNYDKSIKITENIYLEIGLYLKNPFKGNLSIAPLDLNIRWKGDHKGVSLGSAFIFYGVFFEIYDNRHED